MPATNHNDTLSSSSTTATTTAGALSSPEATSGSLISSSSIVDTDTLLLHHLTQTSALEDLHANLLSSLQRTGWTERVRNLSLQLLRAGKCDHFDDMFEAVVALAEGRPLPASTNNDHYDKNNVNSLYKGDARDTELEQFFDTIDVRIPSSVVEQGVKQIKEALRPIIELEDDGGGEHEIDDRRNDSSATTHNGKKLDNKKILKLSATTNSNSSSKAEKVGGAGSGISKSPEKVGKNGDTSKNFSSSTGGGSGGLKKLSKDGAAGKKSQKATSKN
jgi:hypothetical protein